MYECLSQGESEIERVQGEMRTVSVLIPMYFTMPLLGELPTVPE